MACVKTYVANYRVYLKIQGEHSDVPENIGKNVEKDGLYR